ncbi:Oleate-activated transcription factor 1 [Wickerhamomyces ciferrii]|uniref:Oleate-activated transcription factor 1 n=1 Tax=Wickerhamomyces ciferrii (strain ATCC 14091 / BCRC 22168 / CBS 111 / JCM 3599 / NBRC 0793 / NRRL Y-1031 F-60-10) TaxID=1206466 RepID=K0KQV5_WICCF|nr:Oleate-activated transcription factor 1 [Wickerhamomyces ciferrii]CCH45481.1 Oleate-activated transcription factor 1 [Wickerhamomyces ciferrii]
MTTDVNKSNDLESRSKNDLFEEIQFWRSKAISNGSPSGASTSKTTIQELCKSTTPTNGNNTNIPNSLVYSDLGDHSNDIIDFYEGYEPLNFKHSSLEEQKPLNPISIHKVDHYMAFFLCYRFITLKIVSDRFSKVIEQSWKSNHTDGYTKWAFLLEGAENNTEMKKIIERVVKDRVDLFQTNIFPFQHLQESNDESIEYLISEIEAVLPGKLVFNSLLDHFFKYIWVLRPYIDEDIFLQDIQRLVSFNNESLKAKVRVEQRQDFAILATLLIILRYTSVSITITDETHLSRTSVLLKNQIVPVKAITVAQMCVSIYKIVKKTSLEMIQALLYLRVYLKDSPEEGDGLTLGQSQMLFGFIVQSVMMVGMNRDPMYHLGFSDIKLANTRRRIWHAIRSLDIQTSILSGTVGVLPPKHLTSVKFPVITLGDPLERAQLDEMKKESGLNEIHEELCDAINNMESKPTLLEIVSILDRAKDYVENVYPMAPMHPISGLDSDSQLYKASILRNHKILEKRYLQSCVEIIIYQFLFVKYENNNKLDLNLFKLFTKKCVSSIVQALDLSGAYLTDAFKAYLDPAQSNIEFYPLISSVSYRACNALHAIMLRSYHAQELLTSQFGLATSTLGLQTYLERFIKLLNAITEVQLKVYEDHIGVKYHLSLKVVCASKFAFNSLKTHKFAVLQKLIAFLETDDEKQVSEIFNKPCTKEEIKQVFANNKSWYPVYTQWMNISKAKGVGSSNAQQQNKTFGNLDLSDPIVNVNNTNHMINFNEGDISELMSIISNGFRYFATSADLTGLNDSDTSSTGNTSTSEFDNLYDRFSHDPIFNAQMSNFALQRNPSGQRPEFGQLGNEFINDFFSPAIDKMVDVEDFPKNSLW